MAKFEGTFFRKRTTLTKGSSLSATVCDTLYLLDMEGEINELTSQDFSLSDEVHKLLLKTLSLNQFYVTLVDGVKWPPRLALTQFILV